jgi:hydrogenase nickel incorporation protein HypA/HybF
MHELSLAMSLLELAETETIRSGSASVISVNVLIGRLSGVDPEALRFMLDLSKKNTLLDQAVINFELVDGKGKCRACHHEFSIDTLSPVCPGCHGISIEVTGGDQLRIVSMEVE